MFICHPWKAAALRIRVTHSLSRCNVSINALSAIVCTFCHCTSALFHCFAPLSIAPLYFLPLRHCAVPLQLCSISLERFIWPLHCFYQCTLCPCIFLRPLQLLSLHFYLESLFLLTLQYIHYPNIHYQNVARSIINTYIYALQSVDKSIQAQFSIFGQKLGFHTSEKLLHFYHLTFVGWPLLQNVRDSFFYCLTPHREIIAMDQKPDPANYKKYYDTFLCCDTYCHKLQMNNVYERFFSSSMRHLTLSMFQASLSRSTVGWRTATTSPASPQSTSIRYDFWYDKKTTRYQKIVKSFVKLILEKPFSLILDMCILTDPERG